MNGTNATEAYFAPPSSGVLERASSIRAAVFDVDGVLTDGSVWVPAEGEPGYTFHIHDGKGLRMLLDAGIEVVWLTARGCGAVQRRSEELGVRHLLQGRSDKGAAMEAVHERLGLTAAECAYTGDDLIDLPAFRRAGLAVAVADAHPALTARAHWTTRRPGGRGAVREVCELILAAQGKLAAAIQAHET